MPGDLVDGDHRHPMLVSEHLEERQPCGRAVVLEHLADHGHGRQAGEAGKVDGRFGVSAAVEHSMGEARRLGFDALLFNLVFESNPARRLYESLGFAVVGRVPRAVDGEDALVYWRQL